MPLAKSRPTDDVRSDVSTAKERQIAAAANARKAKNGMGLGQNGSSLKELALVSTESANLVVPGQVPGVSAYINGVPHG